MDDAAELTVQDAGQRRALAVELRKQGGSPQVIAEQLRGLPGMTPEYDAAQAATDVREGLAAVVLDGLDEARRLDLLRLDELLSEWWERSKSDGIALGNVMRIMDARALLLQTENAGQRTIAGRQTIPEASTAYDEAEIVAELSRLANPHVEKKKATIIALVDAHLAGKSEESIWSRPDVCNRRTYQVKWKNEPVFAAVLARVNELAQQWRDSRAARALRESAEKLALSSPEAVRVAAATLASTDERTRLSAAFGILDRAGLETATKGTVDVQESGADDARAKLAKLLAGRTGAGDPGSAEGADGS